MAGCTQRDYGDCLTTHTTHPACFHGGGEKGEVMAIVKVGDRFWSRDHGKRRSWGMVTQIDSDNVTVFEASNPANWRTRTESLAAMLLWIEQKAIWRRRIRRTRQEA